MLLWVLNAEHVLNSPNYLLNLYVLHISTSYLQKLNAFKSKRNKICKYFGAVLVALGQDVYFSSSWTYASIQRVSRRLRPLQAGKSTTTLDEEKHYRWMYGLKWMNICLIAIHKKMTTNMHKMWNRRRTCHNVKPTLNNTSNIIQKWF